MKNSNKILKTTHVIGVLVEAGFDEQFELLAEVALQRGRVVLGDEEEDPHGVQVRVRGFPLRQLQRRDAQRPDVRLLSVFVG